MAQPVNLLDQARKQFDESNPSPVAIVAWITQKNEIMFATTAITATGNIHVEAISILLQEVALAVSKREQAFANKKGTLN